MAISSGTRHALSEAASWLVLAILGVATIVYFDELKSLTRWGLGLQSPSMEAIATRPATQQRQTPQSSGTVELAATRHGQYVTFADINGHETKVLVDTGATAVALTNSDAAAAGIYPSASDFTVRVMTANGIGRAAPVVLDSVTVGDITLRNVRALVNQPGTLHVTLLGMTFLKRLSRVDIGDGRMVLEQ